jgi:hypothetical protein
MGVNFMKKVEDILSKYNFDSSVEAYKNSEMVKNVKNVLLKGGKS